MTANDRNTNGYLPDGQQLQFPEDPHFYDEGVRVPAPWMTHDIGQLGFWHAQRPICQCLAVTTATWSASTWIAIGLDVEMIDNYMMHSTDNALNPEDVFPPSTGNSTLYTSNDTYLVIGYIGFNSTSPSNKYAAATFGQNNGVINEGMKVPSATGHGVDCMVIDLIQNNGNNKNASQIDGWEDAGSPTITVTSKCPSLTVLWIGSNRAYTTSRPAPSVPTMGVNDQITGSATGASPAGGVKVPLNPSVFDPVAFHSSPPQARITSAGSSQSITNTGSFVSIQFPTGDLDIWGSWSSASNTKLTCVVAGLYYVHGLAAVSETATKAGYRAVRILHTIAAGGTAIYGGNTAQCATGTSTVGTSLPAVDFIQMAVGDTVELQFAHTNGSTLAVRTGSGDCSRLIMVWTSQ